MVRGRTWLLMARSGRRTRCLRAGRLIVMGLGCGSPPGAGPGLMMRPGDSLPSTTDAGCTGTMRGAGLRDRLVIGTRITRQPWWAGSAERASELAGAGAALVLA